MDTSTDYYGVLGIGESATAAQVKRAYRDMAKRHHPDRGGDEAVFIEVKKAYEVLSDPERRDAYDEMLSRRAQGIASGLSGMSAEARAEFDAFFDSVSRAAQWSSGWDESNSTLHVTVPFDVACTGGVVKARGPSLDLVDVRVRPGVESGDTFVAEGSHEPVLVEVTVADSDWRREGLDVYLDVNVSPFRALLGGAVEAPAVGGDTITLALHQRTPPGEHFRVQNAGSVDWETGRRGNAYYVVRYRVSGDLTEEQRALLEELQRIEDEKSSASEQAA